MKKTILLTILFCFLLFPQSCKKSELLETQYVVIQLNEKGKKLMESSSGFGIDLFKSIAQAETVDKNWMISPLSVSLALAMTYNGADNETKTAIQNTLKINDLTIEEVNINFKQISDALLSIDPKVEISIANSIWYRQNFSVLQDFIDTNTDFYNASVSALNFDDSGAKDIINNWVASNTNHRIESIVDNIDAATVMYLINAIYFKGVWTYKFNKEDNKNVEFHYQDGTSALVEMMTQKTSLKRFTNNELNLVELPYGQGNWVMDLILPTDGITVENLISDFSQTNLDSWITELSEPSEIILTLPPFKFEYEEVLNQTLSTLGMGVAFNPDLADFSKINNDYQLYISNVKHKTFIEVNEVGTEAAAVTSVEVSVTSAQPTIASLTFNKPFLFIIRETSTDAILFMGKVGDPKR